MLNITSTNNLHVPINGHVIVESSLPNLKNKIEQLKNNKLPKQLAIIVATSAPEVHSYIQAKTKFFEELELPLTVIYPKHTKQEVLNWINKLNNDEQIAGILLQLPLAHNLQPYQQKFINAINPQKDIEGLTNYNLGKLVQGMQNRSIHKEEYKTNQNADVTTNSPQFLSSMHQGKYKTIQSADATTNLPQFLSPAVCAIIKMLEFYNINWRNLHWGIIGAGTIVGKPLSAFLTGQKVSFTLLDLGTKNYSILQKADILVTATGTDMRPILLNVKQNILKPGVILIDAGTYHTKADNKLHSDLDLPGDIESLITSTPGYNNIFENIQYYTPKFGSIGPLTVYCLAEMFVRKLLT